MNEHPVRPVPPEVRCPWILADPIVRAVPDVPVHVAVVPRKVNVDDSAGAAGRFHYGGSFAGQVGRVSPTPERYRKFRPGGGRVSRKRQCSGSSVVGESFAELAVRPSCSANVANVTVPVACIGGLRSRAFVERPVCKKIIHSGDSVGSHQGGGHCVVIGSI